MFRSYLRIGAGAVLALSAAAHAASPVSAPDPYQQESATVLPSTNTGWGRLAFDAARSYLFMARRGDGLTVFDVRGKKVVANVPGTTGANDILLLPQLDRAYVANADGTLTTIALSTLTLIKWEKIADAGLNAIAYEPTTGRMFAIAGARPDSSTYIALDARTGQPIGRTDFAGSRMDKPASDEQGAIFAALRDKGVLLKLSAKDLRIEQAWPLGPCEQPVAVEYDKAARRVFIGCRGEKPVLVTLDPATGKVVAALPIGKGVDGLVFDRDNQLLITANGADANMTVIRQLNPDRYQLVETIGTRPEARVLALDPATKNLYCVAAGFTLPAPEPGKPAPAPTFHSDSFTVLSYGRVHQMSERELHDRDDEHEH
jgi:DNA-binding beta-propeller fold protein YncE